jgi:hypothetical protein
VRPARVRLRVRVQCARMGALAQPAPRAAAREFRKKWAAAPKGPAHVRKVPFEAKAFWKIVALRAQAVAPAAAVRIVMALLRVQQKLVTEGPTLGLRLCAGVLGRRGVRDGVSFFPRRRIQKRRLA